MVCLSPLVYSPDLIKLLANTLAAFLFQGVRCVLANSSRKLLIVGPPHFANINSAISDGSGGGGKGLFFVSRPSICMACSWTSRCRGNDQHHSFEVINEIVPVKLCL